jgi:hypothetical protein
MNVEVLKNGRWRILKLSLFALFLTGASLAGWRWLTLTGSDLTPTVYAQQDILLERRISQVEQRFYYIESRLNQLETESRFPGAVPRTSTRNDTELGMLRTYMETLRTELETLRGRVGEIECGVIKLDERTLTPSARQLRRQTAPDSGEPCRANPGSPVRLSARQ